MILCPDKYRPKIIEPNEYFENLKGYLDDKDCKITLAKFLRVNLKLFIEILTGGEIKVQAYQVALLKSFLNRNFTMVVAGRGCGKSFIAALFCVIQMILQKDSKIIISSATFRSAKIIFSYIEKIVTHRNAKLLFDIFDVECKRGGNSDQRWIVNGGEVIAIPLSGDKIRGFRANILLLDEFRLIPESIVEEVLMPFLVSPQNLSERNRTREIENRLIEQGAMKEEDRAVFESSGKMIALSSASYSFENLYKTYKKWTDIIDGKENDDISTYSTFQIAWNAVPKDFMEESVIEMAQNGGSENPSFLREYCAQFTDGSDGFFSAKKISEVTVPNGEAPCTLIRGKPGKKYILAVDPHLANTPTADDFAMALLELDEEKESATLVHAYAFAGADGGQQIKYLYYLFTHFNIVLAVFDNTGADTTIDACNNSKLFIDNGLKINWIENFDATAKGKDYDIEISKFKSQYNHSSNTIALRQYFTTEFVRESNDRLQGAINQKKIWFASPVGAWGSAYSDQLEESINMDLVHYKTKGDLIEEQAVLIERTKNQCAMIKISVTAQGTLQFDLPQHAKRDRGEHRPRRDSYTALLLANWGKKIWFDAQKQQAKQTVATFTPRFIA